MPVEIKELVIQAKVEDNEPSPTSSNSGAESSMNFDEEAFEVLLNERIEGYLEAYKAEILAEVKILLKEDFEKRKRRF